MIKLKKSLNLQFKGFIREENSLSLGFEENSAGSKSKILKPDALQLSKHSINALPQQLLKSVQYLFLSKG